MGNCDVCSTITTWEEGTAYTADEFRTLVRLGFEPHSSVIMLGPAAVQGWKTGLVATCTTGWLLCPPAPGAPACYLSRSAGTGPDGHVLYETMSTDQMLGIVPSAPPTMVAPPLQVIRGDQKECPACCQQIAAGATVCPNCHTTFNVTYRGYCSTERSIVGADEDGNCLGCGKGVLDLYTESQLAVDKINPPEGDRTQAKPEIFPEAIALAEQSEQPLNDGKSKKCPNCGNLIKLEAVLCRYCRARFTIVEKGYCSICHTLVEPAPDGKCPACQGELLDRRTISQLVQEATSAPTTPTATVPVVAQITCHKCKTVNPDGQMRCQSCNTNLLPGEGILMHVGYFVGCVVMTALDLWLLKAVMERSISLNLVCLTPGFLIFAGFAMLIWGVVKMVTPTPRFQRYANRAARHMDTNLPQALSDIDAALALAPKGERPGLLKKREQIHTRLGATQDVLRDQLELALDSETHRTGANVMSMLNMDGDVYADTSSKQDRQALIASGKVKAYGYCKRCNAAVQLDSKLKCPQHSDVRAIQYAIRGDEEIGKQKVMDEIRHMRMISKRRRNQALAVLILIISACFLINYFANKAPQPSQPASLAAVAVNNPETSQPTALATSAPTLALEKAYFILFSDHEVSFEYPSDWKIIDEAGVQALLGGTLKGIGDWDYIGGVYTKSPDDCLDCAHISVSIIPLPEDFTGWSDEFYERIKQNAEDSMGGRLQLHRQVRIGDYPGWETIYLGKSGRTKLWDKSFLPNSEPVLVMISASANPDQFDQFLPLFEQVFTSLSIYGASDTSVVE